MATKSSVDRLQHRIQSDQGRIARGERPLFHAAWTTRSDALDVTIRELPIIHLFVPDPMGVADGARGLIARALVVDPASFDLIVEEPTAG